jgi:NADPH:quinone reductase-like Zn-dependent oxidoreductase
MRPVPKANEVLVRVYAEIDRLIEEGKLKTRVATILPLRHVIKAHRLSRSRGTRGRIVL